MRKWALVALPCLLFACKGPGLGGFPKGSFGDLGEMQKNISLLMRRERSSLGQIVPGTSFFWAHRPRLNELQQGVETLLRPSSDMSLHSAWNNFLLLWSREQVIPWR
ncbi:MAG TPA: hypothetical protein ENK02_05270 [Planctomycetes bacterium]|nr:hypothetical protein [Planctomycetota bacterium]